MREDARQKNCGNSWAVQKVVYTRMFGVDEESLLFQVLCKMCDQEEGISRGNGRATSDPGSD